jgi:CubicO group peptidase (beta-lactamase class C family)
MILVQEGKIAVSDPLSKYIPEFAEMKVLVQNEEGASSTVPANKPITIEHLLTHTSGLTYGFFPNEVSKLYAATGLGLNYEQLAALRGSGGVIGDMAEDYGLTLEEFVKKAAEQPLLVQPGTQWNYSIAMDVLGCVVEVVSGQRYGDFLTRYGTHRRRSQLPPSAPAPSRTLRDRACQAARGGGGRQAGSGLSV